MDTCLSAIIKDINYIRHRILLNLKKKKKKKKVKFLVPLRIYAKQGLLSPLPGASGIRC